MGRGRSTGQKRRRNATKKAQLEEQILEKETTHEEDVEEEQTVNVQEQTAGEEEAKAGEEDEDVEEEEQPDGDEDAQDNGTEVNKDGHEVAEDDENEEDNGTKELNDDDGETLPDQAASEKEKDQLEPPPKKRRGPTKMKHIAKDPTLREHVDFTEFGEPCGPGSVKLSSYLGPLVREHVPIIIDDWRKVGEEIKTVLWKSIKTRFELDEEYQRTAVFRQMGCLWRSSKSRVVTQIRNAKNMKERMQLKPKNIPPLEWRKFVHQKTSSAFKVVSDKYKDKRRKQIPHTVSRKGMVRLTEEMKKQSPEPSTVTRLKVWVKSRTKKDGTPVNTNAAEKIRKAKEVESAGPSSSNATSHKEDGLTQILGPDNPGRLRAMGRGMSMTRLACYQVKSKCMAQMQDKQTELQERVRELEATIQKMNNQKQDEQGETSAPRSVNKTLPPKCLLVDWAGTEDTVAEGRILSADPEEYVDDIPLGPNSVKVLVESATKPDAFLWRPAPKMLCMEEAVSKIIAWPADNCIAAYEEVAEEEVLPKSPCVTSKNRCKLMDWARNDEVVAEGRWHSREPKDLVNGLPLGPNVVKVYVDEVLSPLAFLWRPTTEMAKMEDTLHSFVALPANRVEYQTPTEVTCQKSPQTPKSPRNSTMNSSAGPTSSIQKSTQTPKSNTENFTKTSTAGPSSALDKSPQTPKSSKTNSKAVTSPTAQRSPTLKAPRKTKIVPQSPLRKSKRNIVKDNQKCKLMDLGGKQRVVAEGRWASNDPNQRVHFVPLGPNAVRVWVDVVKIKSAAMWRTSDEIETMEDALGTSIAWPEDKVVMC